MFSFAGFRSGSIWVLWTWRGGFAVPEVLDAATENYQSSMGVSGFFWGVPGDCK